MSQTFYLKYRPQTFSDLDCAAAREELIKIFSSGKIPHAFLFTGTKGIGKTSAARIVAKAVNCRLRQQPTTNSQLPTKGELEAGSRKLEVGFEPCNKCDSCISITNGTNMDVMEIDAASYTSVDDIRDLREKIKLAPSSLKYKVYIIDEVHRLSGSAFDALLKTLEEPPKHAIFILCTTELEKLPKTIVSRCQTVHFKKATKKEIIERLKKNCQAEGLGFEEKALEQIVGLSEGSFRDAVKFLEQVSFSGKITIEEVNKIAGISGEFKPEDLLLLVQERQTKEALLWINRAVESGISLKILLENILEQLRLLVLANLGLGEKSSAFVFSTEELKVLMNLFTQAYQEMRLAVIIQLPLEMVVVEWSSSAKATADNDSVKDEGEKSEVDVNNGANESYEANKINKADPPDNTAVSFSLGEVLQKWPQILEAVKPLNHSVLAFLKACRPKSVEDGFLNLEVFYKFHKDQLETEKCRQIFEKAAGGVLNCNVKLRCTLSSEKPQKIEPAPLPPIAEKKQKVEKNSADDDIIKVAEEIFNKQ